MSTENKWRRFESLVADVQRRLAPDCEVRVDDRIRGAKSGSVRKLDITIRTTVGQYDILIAIDCKDYSRPLSVTKIEEFIGLVEDVGANKGAVVSASGFTPSARARASTAKIDVYTLVDVEDHDWKSYVTIPVLCDFRAVRSYQLEFSATGPFEMERQDLRTLVLRDASGQAIDNVHNLLTEMWNLGRMPIEPGEHTRIPLSDEPTFIMTDGALYRVDVHADIVVETKLYFGQLPLIEIKGFRDEISGLVRTQGFKTDRLDVVRVEREWQRVQSETELAVKPVLRLVALDQYPLMLPAADSSHRA